MHKLALPKSREEPKGGCWEGNQRVCPFLVAVQIPPTVLGLRVTAAFSERELHIFFSKKAFNTQLYGAVPGWNALLHLLTVGAP